jgi:hypothetical protein
MLEHFTQSITVHVDSEIADSDEIPVGIYDSITIFCPSTGGLINVAVYAAPQIGGDYSALYDSTGAAVATPTMTSGGAYTLSFQGKALKAIKLLGNTDDDLDVTLKT